MAISIFGIKSLGESVPPCPASHNPWLCSVSRLQNDIKHTPGMLICRFLIHLSSTLGWVKIWYTFSHFLVGCMVSSCKSKSRITNVFLSVTKTPLLQAYWPSTIMPIHHCAYQLSSLLMIMPFDHCFYCQSCLLTVVPITYLVRAYESCEILQLVLYNETFLTEL